MINYIRSLKNKIKRLPWKRLSESGFYKGNNIPVKFIIENADWAIKFVGENIKREIDIISPGKLELSAKPYRFTENVIHFGSQYMWLNWGNNGQRRTNEEPKWPPPSIKIGCRPDGPPLMRIKKK